MSEKYRSSSKAVKNKGIIIPAISTTTTANSERRSQNNGEDHSHG